MADSKMSTIVMMVDLECDRCYKKIRRVLCKLQDKASIKAISYDEKNNTVTVAGPFDADEVSDRLCSSAGKVITDIRVVSGKPMPGGTAKAHANKPGKDGGGGGGGGGGGKPEIIKKHVKFEMADDIDDGHHHHHDNRKPKVVTTNHAAAAAAAAGGALSRMEGRRAEPNMAMAAAMAPVPMPMTVQATATPSIWPAPAPAPLEWGHSTPTYGAGWAPPPSGGYYGGGGPMYYGQPAPAAYGYGGRNPYQPQYYDEEPAGCSVM